MQTSLSPNSTVDRALRDKWIKALRSGEYEQTSGSLEAGGKFCCLGVLCKLENVNPSIETKAGEITHDPYFVLENDLLKRDYGVFVEMNDAEGMSFSEIADYIEANL